jgi:hypothetical protein
MTEFRCEHGFLQSAVRCPTCSPHPSDTLGERAPSKRARNGISFRIGNVVAGVTIIARTGDQITALCGCGEKYVVSRTAIANRAKSGRVAMCWECLRRVAA